MACKFFQGSLLMMVLFCGTTLADEVKLKSGKVVKGIIISDDGKTVRIETVEGKTERFRHEDVQSVAESPEIGDEAVDAKLKEIDGENANALCEVAKWAKQENHKGWKLVAKLALKREPSHDEAHELLEHIKVGDKWFTNKADADKAKKDLLAKKYAEEGFIKFKDGWIKKEDKPLADKDPKAFMKDEEGLYRSTSTVMKEKGFTLIGEKWVKAGTPEDQSDMKKFEELLSEKIWVQTTPHFRIFAQQYPPEKVDEFATLLEKTYDWFVKEMGKEPDFNVFRGNRAMFWILKDKGMVLQWYKNYRNRYSLDDDFQKLLEMGSGNVTDSSKPIGTIVPDQNRDIRNQLCHMAGHHLIFWFSPGIEGSPSWLREGFGHHAEHVQLGNGVVNCSTLAKYAESGGVAQKEFTTKDAHDRAKTLMREGNDEIFETLTKLNLNDLDGNHLTKGWTMVEWLLKDHRNKFIAWLEGMNTAHTLDALAKAFEGWTGAKLDEEWRKYVKKNF